MQQGTTKPTALHEECCLLGCYAVKTSNLTQHFMFSEDLLYNISSRYHNVGVRVSRVIECTEGRHIHIVGATKIKCTAPVILL
jgi:hypothetical protein